MKVLFCIAVAAVLSGCASVPSEGFDGGYFSQFRCEGDCAEDSGCPYCCGEGDLGE